MTANFPDEKMGSRQGPSRTGNPLAPFRFRVSSDMAERIKAESRHDGLTESAWVRCVLADRLAMDDPADRQPVRRYGGLSADARELMALRMQLHQLGGLLVQTAKASRLAGQTEQHADLEATLVEIRNAIAVIHGLQRGAR